MFKRRTTCVFMMLTILMGFLSPSGVQASERVTTLLRQDVPEDQDGSDGVLVDSVTGFSLAGGLLDQIMAELCPSGQDACLGDITELFGEATGIDLEGLLTHERGHTMGLGDVDTDGRGHITMGGASVNCSKETRSLGKGDVLGLKDLYNRP